MKLKTLVMSIAICMSVLFAGVGTAQGADPTPGRITAHDIAQMHERHGDSQWRHGRGTPGHTWAMYRYEAALLRNYLRAVAIAQYVQALRANLVWRWSGVANCESGGNWAINTGNGYYGGVQFTLSTWRSVGGSGYPHQNSAYEQAYRAEILKNRAGLGQWPNCGRFYR